MSDAIGVALLGLGNVGGAVAAALLERADELAERAGAPLALRRVAVRDPARRATRRSRRACSRGTRWRRRPTPRRTS